MNASADEVPAVHVSNDEFRVPDPATRHGVPPGLVAQRLIAVPWRHAGLIAVCAVVGGLASALFWSPPAPAHVAAAVPRVQEILDAPSAPSPGGVDLRLDLEPGAAVVRADATPASSPTLRSGAARPLDEIDAMLRLAPPSAGRVMRAPPAGGARTDVMLPGLVAGLVLGLLVAARRELGGERMRSPREAEWALGAPVLGAIPTLSAKARDALLEPSPTPPDAA